jgi:sugar phosphate isomerase/epimerase
MATSVAGAQKSAKGKRRFTIALVGGAIGVSGTIQQQLDWAVKYGYESIEPIRSGLIGLSRTEINELNTKLKERNLQWAITGVPASVREQSESVFAGQLSEVEKAAEAWEAAGVKRVKTWVASFSENLNYLENFKLHTDRIRRIAKVLGDHGLSFGLEYLGPKTLWAMENHSFIHSMAETQELIAATGQDNVGLVLDSWHWYCAHETVDHILALDAKDVISVDLNDAPAGIEIDQQVDSRRRLPATTGVIDTKGFLGALVKIGFDGSVMAEPFSDVLNAMDDERALERTAESMKRAFSLVE